MAPLPPFSDPTTLPGLIRDKFLQGVYNESYETLFNGGPSCYNESLLGFKIILSTILVSQRHNKSHLEYTQKYNREICKIKSVNMSYTLSNYI